jgi:hypothetical protein
MVDRPGSGKSFPDLAPYARALRGGVWPNVLTVGWLDPDRPPAQGAVDPGFVSKLYDVVFGSPSFNAHIGVLRNAEPCMMCGRKITVPHHGEEFYLGRSEIWVPAQDPVRYFSSPSLIPHYVETHRYVPPEAFVSAVMDVSLDDRYNAQREYRVMGYWHHRLEEAGLLDRLK